MLFHAMLYTICVCLHVYINTFLGDQVESVEKLFCILSTDTIDISLRRSAAEQLTVVLQGEVPVKASNGNVE